MLNWLPGPTLYQPLSLAAISAAEWPSYVSSPESLDLQDYSITFFYISVDDDIDDEDAYNNENICSSSKDDQDNHNKNNHDKDQNKLN